MNQKPDILDQVRSALSSALTMEPDFTPTRLDYDELGTVILEGEVGSVPAKKLALEAVAAVPEVSGVVDRLRIRPASAMSDAGIRAHLRNVYSQEQAFAAIEVAERSDDQVTLVKGAPVDVVGRVEFHVDEGVVTLNGQVPGLDRKRLAGVLAWWIPGTRDVVNGLVAPLEDETTGMMQEAVRIVLEKDPFIDAGQIRVGVEGRTVRLTGLVPNQAERDMAGRDAWYVFGVDKVINDIHVGP